MKNKIKTFLCKKFNIDLFEIERLKQENKFLENKISILTKEVNSSLKDFNIIWNVSYSDIKSHNPPGFEYKDHAESYNAGANCSRLIYKQKLEAIKYLIEKK